MCLTNVLQEGELIESHYAVGTEKPDHLQTDAGVSVCAEAYGRLTTAVLPVGDGAALTVKTKDKIEISRGKGQ